MKANKGRLARRALTTLITTALVLLVIHLILKYVSIVVFGLQNGFFFELANRFDVNDENSVPQWFSQMLFLGIGMSALLAAYLQKNKNVRKLWFIFGVVGVILSVDDVASLHEFTLQMIHNALFINTPPTLFVNAWLVLMPIFLIFGGWLAYKAWKLLPRRTALLFVLGGTVYVVGKITMDSIANEIPDLFLNQGVMQGLEKIFQYIGAIIVLFGCLDFLETNHSAQIKKAVTELKRS